MTRPSNLNPPRRPTSELAEPVGWRTRQASRVWRKKLLPGGDAHKTIDAPIRAQMNAGHALRAAPCCTAITSPKSMRTTSARKNKSEATRSCARLRNRYTSQSRLTHARGASRGTRQRTEACVDQARIQAGAAQICSARTALIIAIQTNAMKTTKLSSHKGSGLQRVVRG